MKVVVISDTHNKQDSIQVPDGDLLIHCGDLSTHGSLVELSAFNRWLGTLPHKVKLCIPGNHDFICEELPALAKQTLTNAKLLIDEAVEIDGLKIYGSPWVPEYGRWAYMLPRGEMHKVWERIPSGLDILITHGPQYLTLDQTRKGVNAGCGALRNRLSEVRPRYHFFGHIHEGYGNISTAYKVDGDYKYIHHYNAATCDKAYEPVNKPIELEIRDENRPGL